MLKSNANATSAEGERRRAGYSYPSNQVRGGPAPLASFEDLPTEEQASDCSSPQSPVSNWLLQNSFLPQSSTQAIDSGPESFLFDSTNERLLNQLIQLPTNRSANQTDQINSICVFTSELSVDKKTIVLTSERKARPNQLRYARPPSLSGSIISLTPVNSPTPTRELLSPALTLTPMATSNSQHCSAQSLLSRPITPNEMNSNASLNNQSRPASVLTVHSNERPSSAQAFLAPPSSSSAYARSHSLDVGNSLSPDHCFTNPSVRRKSSWTEFLFRRRSKSASDRSEQAPPDAKHESKPLRPSTKRRSLFSFFRSHKSNEAHRNHSSDQRLTNRNHSKQSQPTLQLQTDCDLSHIPAWKEFDSEASFHARHLQLLKELAAMHSPIPLKTASTSNHSLCSVTTDSSPKQPSFVPAVPMPAKEAESKQTMPTTNVMIPHLPPPIAIEPPSECVELTNSNVHHSVSRELELENLPATCSDMNDDEEDDEAGDACAESEPQDLHSKIKQDILREEKFLDDVGDDNTFVDATEDQFSSIACFESGFDGEPDCANCDSNANHSLNQSDQANRKIRFSNKRADTLDDVHSLPELLPSNRPAHQGNSIEMNQNKQFQEQSIDSEEATLIPLNTETRKLHYLKHGPPEEHEISSLLQEEEDDEEEEDVNTDQVLQEDDSNTLEFKPEFDDQDDDETSNDNDRYCLDTADSESTQLTHISDDQAKSNGRSNEMIWSANSSRRSSRVGGARDLVLQPLERPRSSTPVPIASLDTLIKANASEFETTATAGLAKLSIHLPGEQFEQRLRSPRLSNPEGWMQFCERSLQSSPRHPIKDDQFGNHDDDNGNDDDDDDGNDEQELNANNAASHFNWPDTGELVRNSNSGTNSSSVQSFADNFIDAFSNSVCNATQVDSNNNDVNSKPSLASSSECKSSKSKPTRLSSMSSDISSASSRLFELSPSEDTQSCALSLSNRSALSYSAMDSKHNSLDCSSSRNSVSEHAPELSELHS